MSEQSPFGGNWDPFYEFNQMMESAFSNFFDEFKTPHSLVTSLGKQSFPKVNAKYNTKNKTVIIEASLPGFQKEDINVDIKPMRMEGYSKPLNVLIISGRSNNARSNEEENYFVREISRTSFSRSLILPDEVREEDLDKVKSTLKEGLLTIVIPCEVKQVDKPKTRRLEIEDDSK